MKQGGRRPAEEIKSVESKIERGERRTKGEKGRRRGDEGEVRES